MYFNKLSLNSKKLLDELLMADNASNMLREKFKNLSRKEDEELRTLIRELVEEGYIKVKWADNVPYLVFINNSARTYEEKLAEYEATNKRIMNVYNIDNSVKIGDGNTISNTKIASKIENEQKSSFPQEKKDFATKHPILLNMVIGLVTGLILMFSFWREVIKWIERLF